MRMVDALGNGSSPPSQAGIPNTSTPSFRYGWIYGKIAKPPEALASTSPKAPFWRKLTRWNPRDPLTLTVTYRGGAECWIEVKARGRLGRYPGHVAIYEVLRDVWNSP